MAPAARCDSIREHALNVLAAPVCGLSLCKGSSAAVLRQVRHQESIQAIEQQCPVQIRRGT